MAVQMSDIYVSQAAYDYVKSQRFSEAKESENTDSNNPNANSLLSELAKKYSNFKFNANTQQGLNNLSIAPNILQEMAQDPKVREKYEALIYDINELAKNPLRKNLLGGEIEASGFVINADGSVSGWSISRSKSESNEKSYIEKMLEELEKIRKEREEKEGRKEDFSVNFTLNVKA
ncbi:MAG: hypothetical protein K2N75_05630 [Helicobacter sp.]|uniref:DUF6033 family protein n=1 Tax=Helicobacter sp. TaxID=218 RepID=UPI0023C3F155|nr:DUF6033 family protein [Helicobacter sp.]MDE5926029.1 hypothetical protein [Helicobacter sp.]MDE7175507.1 hypothetical protein [Helicobacter sp.]